MGNSHHKQLISAAALLGGSKPSTELAPPLSGTEFIPQPAPPLFTSLSWPLAATQDKSDLFDGWMFFADGCTNSVHLFDCTNSSLARWFHHLSCFLLVVSFTATSVILSQSRTLNIYDLLALFLHLFQCQLAEFPTCFRSIGSK
jgi:hypothetical protein